MQSGTEIFLQSVKSICPNLAEDELTQFAAKLTVKAFKKKAYFVESDKIQKK